MTNEYFKSVEILRERTLAQLKTVREIKRREIENYFHQICLEANFLAKSSLIVQAIKDFKQAFLQIDTLRTASAAREYLSDYYTKEWLDKTNHPSKDTFQPQRYIPQDARSIILQSQYLIGNKQVIKPLAYHNIHQKYHGAMAGFARTYGYYDMMLVEDESGYVVYTLNKEIDFGTSLLNGAHANTHLGEIFRKIRHTGLKHQTVLSDFERYAPSYFAPAAFVATAIFDNDVKIGTLIFQIPVDKIDAITTSRRAWKEEGLGESGECYIVGLDGKMRTDSRFMIESPEAYLDNLQKNKYADEQTLALMRFYKTTILFEYVDNPAIRRAFALQTGTMSVRDYRGVEVLSSYTPLSIADVHWIMAADIDTAEAFAPVRAFTIRSINIVVVLVFLVVLASALFARSVYMPIRKLAIANEALGKGNLDVRVDIVRNDEIGMLAQSFNRTVASLKEQHEEIVSKNTQLHAQKEEISLQADNLKSLNNEIAQMNVVLEERIQRRTEHLLRQNEQLSQYAFLNSHRLRAPVANILGLCTLVEMAELPEEKLQYITLIAQAAKNLDNIVHEIQAVIDTTSDEEALPAPQANEPSEDNL